MTIDRTELEWTYEPKDFFEAPYQYAEVDFELKIESGKALATLTVPTLDLEARVRSLVESVFLVRQLQLHRSYKLEGPTDFPVFIGSQKEKKGNGSDGFPAQVQR